MTGCCVPHRCRSGKKSAYFRTLQLFNQRINVSGIKLWHPNNPNLNFIKTEVWVDGIMVDAIKTRFGVRSVKMNGPKGLYINGEPFNEKLIGANRHQDYVHVGNALPNSGQWRDVKKLRGFQRPTPQIISELELNQMRNQMNAMAAANMQLQQQLANAQQPVEVEDT